MKKLTIKLKNSYDVLIEKGLLQKSGELIKAISKSNKAFVISDSNVYNFYGKELMTSLEKAGFKTAKFIFEAGEKSKNLHTIEKIYQELALFNMTRSDIIVDLGGGVCGDIAGFCASTFLRGVPCVHIPTSLIAQVDSSIGGKTGVNLENGKNLVGTFYQPSLVIVDPLLLDTLEDLYFEDGMAEVIKYAAIKDKSLFLKLLSNDPRKDIEEVIFTCLSIKKEFVEEDEFDKSSRMLLNFGHTIGHAIESYYNYNKFSHGQAVALGMKYISMFGEEIGITSKGTSKQIEDILKLYSLPTEIEGSLSEILKYISLDKKNILGQLNLILIKEIGESIVYPIDINDFKLNLG